MTEMSAHAALAGTCGSVPAHFGVQSEIDGQVKLWYRRWAAVKAVCYVGGLGGNLWDGFPPIFGVFATRDPFDQHGTPNGVKSRGDRFQTFSKVGRRQSCYYNHRTPLWSNCLIRKRRVLFPK